MFYIKDGINTVINPARKKKNLNQQLFIIIIKFCFVLNKIDPFGSLFVINKKV